MKENTTFALRISRFVIIYACPLSLSVDRRSSLILSALPSSNTQSQIRPTMRGRLNYNLMEYLPDRRLRLLRFPYISLLDLYSSQGTPHLYLAKSPSEK